MQHGGALLSEIIFTVTGSDHFVVIHVDNDGDKIKQNEIEVCFDRFSQIGEHAGSSLGLAIVHEITKIHKGEIRVATQPRMRFTFSIPSLIPT